MMKYSLLFLMTVSAITDIKLLEFYQNTPITSVISTFCTFCAILGSISLIFEMKADLEFDNQFWKDYEENPEMTIAYWEIKQELCGHLHDW